MSKVSKADFAATAPWSGIIGKPAVFGATDIGQLTGIGFSNGQLARWNGSKFVPYTIPPSPTPDPTPDSPLPPQDQFVWDVPSIAPLQSAYEDFPLIGATPGTPCAVGAAFDLQFCLVFANIFANDSIRITVLNMNSVAVDLGSGVFAVQRFP